LINDKLQLLHDIVRLDLGVSIDEALQSARKQGRAGNLPRLIVFLQTNLQPNMLQAFVGNL